MGIRYSYGIRSIGLGSSYGTGATRLHCVVTPKTTLLTLVDLFGSLAFGKTSVLVKTLNQETHRSILKSLSRSMSLESYSFLILLLQLPS